MSELIETLKQRKVLTHLSLGAEEYQRWILLLPEERDAIIAALEDREWLRTAASKLHRALEDRERLRAWIDNHEYLAAYPSLTECIEDQKRAALEDDQRLRAAVIRHLNECEDGISLVDLRAALDRRDG